MQNPRHGMPGHVHAAVTVTTDSRPDALSLLDTIVGAQAVGTGAGRQQQRAVAPAKPARQPASVWAAAIKEEPLNLMDASTANAPTVQQTLKPQGARGRICNCGDPSCQIGPFVEV